MIEPTDARTASSQPFEFGAILMDDIVGQTLGDVLAASEDTTGLVGMPPARALIPQLAEDGLDLYRALNEAVFSMCTAGLQTSDYHAQNLIVQNPGAGKPWHLTWIDMGAFQPLYHKCRLSQKFYPPTGETSLTRAPVEADPQLEHEMHSHLHLLTGRCDINPHEKRALLLQRFREFRYAPEKTFAYRLLMESICFPASLDAEAMELPFLLEVIRLTAAIVQLEGAVSPTQKQWARTFVKLNRLVCGPISTSQTITEADACALHRFEQLSLKRGYQQLCEYFSHDVEPEDEDWDPAIFEEELPDGEGGNSVSEVIGLIEANEPIFDQFWYSRSSMSCSDATARLRERFSFLRSWDLSGYSPSSVSVFSSHLNDGPKALVPTPDFVSRPLTTTQYSLLSSQQIAHLSQLRL